MHAEATSHTAVSHPSHALFQTCATAVYMYFGGISTARHNPHFSFLEQPYLVGYDKNATAVQPIVIVPSQKVSRTPPSQHCCLHSRTQPLSQGHTRHHHGQPNQGIKCVLRVRPLHGCRGGGQNNAAKAPCWEAADTALVTRAM